MLGVDEGESAAGDGPKERVRIDDVAAHIDRVGKIAGIDAVGIGSDYDGVGCVPTGLEDVSKFPNLTRALLEHGFRAYGQVPEWVYPPGFMPWVLGGVWIGNHFGVPWIILLIAMFAPILVIDIQGSASALHGLADMYGIGVVGAIAVNLGSTAFNRRLPMLRHERAVMIVTFVVLAAIEITIAVEVGNSDAASVFNAVRSQRSCYVDELVVSDIGE